MHKRFENDEFVNRPENKNNPAFMLLIDELGKLFDSFESTAKRMKYLGRWAYFGMACAIYWGCELLYVTFLR